MRKSTRLGLGSEAQPWAGASPGTRLGGAAKGRPGASEPGPRAGPCPWLCLRAGSQYGPFPHGPNMVLFIFWVFRKKGPCRKGLDWDYQRHVYSSVFVSLVVVYITATMPELRFRIEPPKLCPRFEPPSTLIISKKNDLLSI